MDGDVQLAFQKFLFQLLDEDAQAHSCQSGSLVYVAPGSDGVDLEFEGRAIGLQPFDDHMVLDQGQGAAPAAHFDGWDARFR